MRSKVDVALAAVLGEPNVQDAAASKSALATRITMTAVTGSHVAAVEDGRRA